MRIEEAIQELTEDMELYESATIVPGDGSLAGKRILALDMARIALEKQIPKKVILGYDEQDSICCPNCKGELMPMDWYDHWKCNYCEVCGQALDWSDKE